MSAAMEEGCWNCSTQWVMVAILKSILCWTGSQTQTEADLGLGIDLGKSTWVDLDLRSRVKSDSYAAAVNKSTSSRFWVILGSSQVSWADRNDSQVWTETFGPQRVQGYSEQAGGGPDGKQMRQRGEQCNNQAVIRRHCLLAASVLSK